jgi:hypothetical protein
VWQVADPNAKSLLSGFSADARREGFQKALQLLESRVERDAAFPVAVRVPYRTAMLRLFGQTTDKTSLGRNGFLFYRDDVDYATGPGPLSHRHAARIDDARDLRGDAFEEAVRSVVRRVRGLAAPPPAEAPPLVDSATAIRDAVRQFRARGLRVLVVPIPGKVSIYPEHYAPGYPLAEGPADNRDMGRWKQLLLDEGIPLVDLSPTMWAAKDGADHLLYLRTDSHWSPTGLAVAADAIAVRAAEVVGPAPPSPFSTEQETIEYRGDQPKLLDVFNAFELFPPEQITLTRVRHGTAKDIVGDDAPVLLLGDSFTMMYHGDDPASGAGLAAQLMLRLGRGVQTVARNGFTPASVLHELQKRPESLAHKKLVVWTFADRGIVAVKAWETVPLPGP